MKNEQRKVPQIRFPGFTEEWELRKLSILTSLITKGTTPLDKSGVGEINFIKVENLDSSSGEIISCSKITKEEHEGYLKRSQLKENDILFSIAGTLGRVGIVKLSVLPANTNQALSIIRLKDGYLKYIATVLRGNAVERFIRRNPTIGAQPNLSLEQVGNLEIPYPQIEEQIIIGDFFDNLDTLITLQQRKLDQIKEYKKGMLQKMFPKDGESVPEVRFPGFSGEWERRKVSDVAEIIAGGTPSTSVESYWVPKEIPWLSSGEVHKKYITFTDNKISTEGMNHSSARMIRANSVLIALAGQGKTRGTVAINRIPLTTNQSIAAMTFTEDIVPEFVYCNLDNRYDEIRKMSSGDGARGGLNKQIVGDIEIPYTSKEEQKQIGMFFINIDTLITLHQRKLEAMKEYKKGLLQQMFV